MSDKYSRNRGIWIEVVSQLIALGGALLAAKFAMSYLDPYKEQKEQARKRSLFLRQRLGRNLELNEYEMILAANVMNPNDIDVEMSDVKGLDHIIDEIELKVLLPLNQPQLYCTTLLRQAKGVLLYGPPGTGKTMAAKRLARTSGLDYAIMSGGDVSQLGAKAVTQLHETFDWAEKSRRGLLLFIDEADAFLGRRSANMSEGLRGALNATLYRTGDQSKDFMVVLATNRPGDLDDAVIDRMDESLEFGLPTEAERRNILNLYFNSYISKSGTTEAGAGAGSENISKKFEGLVKGQKTVSDAIDVTEFDLALVDEAAKKTEGFSGRELAKFMASIQASSYGTVDGKLSNQLFRSVLERKLQEHQHRKEFQNGKNFV
mmetsp:Transcript_2327/g.3517  ORF Transcript_2327/g.3517 Transcript_2327/m.3517 type:complete len:375 (-) Transcript_2327:153-1277(-)